MITYMGTIENLIKWLDSITNLTPNPIEFSDEQLDAFSTVKTVLSQLPPTYPKVFKTCVRCKKVHPETEDWFDWVGQGRSGLSPYCKFCRKSYQKNYKQQQRQQQQRQQQQRQQQQRHQRQQRPDRQIDPEIGISAQAPAYGSI